MVNSVMVFGAHSYIGFSLIEKFLEEGVEVTGIFTEPSRDDQKNLLNERLMLIGRNAYFQAKFSSRHLTEENQADVIMFCFDMEEKDLKEEEFKKAIQLAKKHKTQFLLIGSNVIHPNKDRNPFIETGLSYLSEQLDHYSVLFFPSLYGPFQPPEEKIHQHLLAYIDNKQTSLNIEEPIMYIEDATNAVWAYMDELELGKMYSFLSELNDETNSFSVELKMNATFSEVDEVFEKQVLHSSTSIEKGLEKQLDTIIRFQDIYKLK
ncbi:hypothetical protein [Metabacillus sp. B2-18]|uniref:hypothetical protein n=1 Tax=Metabacillus sp. B2-18 TaxID=2897333 RepID=UPI001E3D949D|nr:hypothetical protein [Metabacillus sp. B2-18]UGB31790.1 hypothetical protein LPC09_04740 [Metabacillus sp. B2-18]